MKQIFERLIETFTLVGFERTATELAHMGYHSEAKKLLLEADRIRKDRKKDL